MQPTRVHTEMSKFFDHVITTQMQMWSIQLPHTVDPGNSTPTTRGREKRDAPPHGLNEMP